MKFLLLATVSVLASIVEEDKSFDGYIPQATFHNEFEGEFTIDPEAELSEIKEFGLKSLLSHISVSPETIVVSDSSYCKYENCFVYFDHIVEDRVVENHEAGLSVRDGKLHTLFYNYAKDPLINRCEGRILYEEELISNAQLALNATYVDVGTKPVFYETTEGLVSSLKFEVKNEKEGHMGVIVEECNGEIVEAYYLV